MHSHACVRVSQCACGPVGQWTIVPVCPCTTSVHMSMGVCSLFVLQDNCFSFLHSVACQLSSAPLIAPQYGSMLGGTPITVTITGECSKQIAAPPMCVFDGDKVTNAVNDSALATRDNKFFCATPAFDSDGHVTFEFRAVLKDGGTLSLHTDFFLCEYTAFYIM